jgi:hypothetical protein
MKERNANKSHQQRCQGRHDQPQVTPPPVSERHEPAASDHDKEIERGRERVPAPARPSHERG